MVLLHGYLDVQIISGAGLGKQKPSGFLNGLSALALQSGLDPYVSVSLGGKNKYFQSRVINNSGDPVWESSVLLDVCHELDFVELRVKGAARAGVGRARKLGRVELPADELLRSGIIEGTYNLVPFVDNDEEHVEDGDLGSVTVKIRLLPLDSFVDRLDVPGTYFPLRTGCQVRLYQDAHVDENDLPAVPGSSYVPGCCFRDMYQVMNAARDFIYITGWSVFTEISLLRERHGGGDNPETRAAANVKAVFGAARSAHIAASRYSYVAVLLLLAIPFCGGLFLVLAATSGRRAGNVKLDELRQARFKAVFKTRAPAVSLLLACKNREAVVELGAKAWAALPGVGEIVLVDWGATMPALPSFPALAEMSSSGKLLYVSVGNSSTPWSLPRSYNLAAHLALGNFLLKLDCDTQIDPSFLETHPMNLDSPVFYTSESDTLSGVLLVARSRFFHVGGYDERLEGFGGEAVDLRARLVKEKGEMAPLREDLVTHSRSEELLYQDDAVIVPGFARRRHANGLKLIGHPWSRSLARQMGGSYDFGFSLAHSLVKVTIMTEARELFSLLGEQKAEKATATALSETLHDDFRVPWDVIPQLTVEDQQYLVSRFHATKQDARALFALINGQAAGERLHSVVSALQLGLHHKLPVIIVWAGQEPADEGASEKTLVVLEDLFDLQATNKKLEEIGGLLKSHSTGDGIASVRLISLREWKCRQTDAHRCASPDHGSAGDKMYVAVSQLPIPAGRRVWDETDPVPLRPGMHTLLRLTGAVRIGNEASRAAAYGALVPNAEVLAALADRWDGEDKVAVFATANKLAIQHFAGPIYAEAGAGQTLNEKGEVRLVVTGPAWVTMKAFMYGLNAVKGMDVPARRNVPKAVAELADALAAAKCKTVWPDLTKLANFYNDPAAMALMDTRPLAQNY